MLLTAQLHALTVVHTFFFSTEPRVANESRNRILLHPKGGHHPRVNHIVCRRDHAHFLTNGHHQRVVRLQQIVVRLRTGAGIGQRAVRRIQTRHETDALTLALDVVVTPLPLHTGDLDRQVRVGRVFLGHQYFGRRQSHTNHNQERHDGPTQLHPQGLRQLLRFVTD